MSLQKIVIAFSTCLISIGSSGSAITDPCNDSLDPQPIFVSGTTPENLFQIRIESFPSNEQFSKLMMEEIVTHLAKKFVLGGSHPLREVLKYIGKRRRFIAKAMGEPTLLAAFMLRDEVPTTVADKLVTRFTGKRFQAIQESIEAGRVIISDPKNREIEIGGDVVRVTWALNDREWVHPSLDGDYYRIFKHTEDIFQDILKSGSQNKRDQLGKIAELHWWLVNLVPLYKGSASVADALAKALMIHSSIPLSNWKQGIAPDIEAFHRMLDDYVESYPTFFEGSVLQE